MAGAAAACSWVKLLCGQKWSGAVPVPEGLPGTRPPPHPSPRHGARAGGPEAALAAEAKPPGFIALRGLRRGAFAGHPRPEPAGRWAQGAAATGDPGRRSEARERDRGDRLVTLLRPPSSGERGWPRGAGSPRPPVLARMGAVPRHANEEADPVQEPVGKGEGIVPRERRLLTDTQQLTMPEPDCLTWILVLSPTS